MLTQLDDDGREFVVAMPIEGQSIAHMEAKYSSYEGSALQLFGLFHHYDVIFMVAHSL
jgi:hypothetical protein